jgi:hypothetical protein
MTTIITQSGKTFHATGDFVIQPEVSFSQVAILATSLPSSEEGRAAFRIVEETIATVQARFISATFMGGDVSEVISTKIVYGLVDSVSSDVESSAVYSRMNDENKKKIQIRLRKLLEAVAEKEAIEMNATLLATSGPTHDVEAKIADIMFKINRLLGVYSNKPSIEMQDLAKGVDAFIANQAIPDTMERALVMESLLKEINGNYQILA